MVVGPDHNIWFTELTGEKIGRLTTSGTLTEFKISGAQSLVGIASGPDGNIWFTDQFAGKVGHINTSGGLLKAFSLPAGSHPQGLTVGPDGNLWFVDQKNTGKFTIGKITTAGKIKEYSGTVNAGAFYNYFNVGQITAGPDGNLWFTNPQAGFPYVLGKITTAGAVTIYTTADLPAGAIVSGPDGNLWATESSHVAKITTSGFETEYQLTVSGGSAGIVVGPDGNLWFTETATLGKITTTGTLTEFPPNTFANFSFLLGITSGPDGNLWFTAFFNSKIGQFTTSGNLTNTVALNNGSGPTWDTLGPDDAVWFSDLNSNQIGRISTAGKVTQFPIPTANSGPGGIATGFDGKLWFVEENVNQVANITTSGAVTEYSLGTGFRGLWGITEGPDENVWFTEYSPQFGNKVASININGVITEYSLPTQNAYPFFITSGPDGNLWFTEMVASQVGKINPSTNVITEYSIGANKSPGPITVGPDGNLWFLEETTAGAIGVINTSGMLLAEYPVNFSGFDLPSGLVAGSDGALWLAEYYPNNVARVTTTGVVSLVPLTASNAQGNDLAVGADHKLWVVDAAAGEVSRLSAIGGTGDLITAIHGQLFNGAVATFVDGTPTATTSNFTASINWGDGMKSAGTVTGPTGGPFTVSGSHTYTKLGTFTLTVSATEKVDKSTYQASPGTATVN
jgi:streptogramin lyase